MTHIGIIGAGNISETHARACREIQGVEIAAVHGAQHDARAGAGERVWRRRCTTICAALVEHRPLDAVIIGSPSGVHAEQGVAAARAGLHVLVEKPIDVTVAAADRLITAARDNGVRLGVLFQDRTQPSFVRLRELLASGASAARFSPPRASSGIGRRSTTAAPAGAARARSTAAARSSTRASTRSIC